MNILRFFHKNQRKGFTLMETLVTVGIVAVLCAIAIPSIITVNRSMKERDLDNSARAVYLAAQSNLAQMRSNGDLEKLAAMTWEADGAFRVPENGNAGMGADWNEQLCYTVTGTDAFEFVLPASVLDSQLREQQILIEYNPFSGHVYAVFYSEGEQELTYSLIGDRKDEAALKEKGIGYYYGGSVTIAPAEVNSTAVTLSADTDGQELFASVTVPVPESYTNHQDKFHEYLSAKLTIRGEMSGAELVIPTDSLSLKKELCIGSPNYIEFTFVLDSLNSGMSFGKLDDALQEQGKSERFTLGENLTIVADVQFDAPEGETILTFDEMVITGVNSLFAEMKENKDASGNVVSYEVELSNGRHLQNLNAISSNIANAVAEIRLVEDIYWNETVEYYNGSYDLFAPISATFKDGAVFSGTKTDGNYRILYLNIDATGDAGLFSVCNLAQVKDLAIVSPTVKGTQNVGALAGAATGAVIENCSVYIDTEDKYFSWDKMETYGIKSSGSDAGGLVGYATNGVFTNCFAAVNVDAAENAGGFVGHSNGANASMCYASGNVTGKTAGGFVGVNDNAEYMQCFASGDVYADVIDGVAGGFVGKLADYAENAVTFSECYAVGVVGGESDATLDGFCGTGLDEPKENETYENKVYQNTYYLNRAEDANVTSLCAAPANYMDLATKTQSPNALVRLINWDFAKKTFRYSVTEDGDYPFLVYSGDLYYYGDWPEETAPLAIAYFETYDDDNDNDKDDIGYYISDEKTSTLRNEDLTDETVEISVESDGYVLLLNIPNAQVMVKGYNDNEAINARSDERYNGFDIYDLPNTKTGDSYYNEVVVKQTKTNEEPITYTLYYNPDFALTQLNPVFNEKGEIEEEVKAEGVPSKIYIRTARHLAAIAENEDYQGSIYNYIQMIDVDFGSYDWGTEGYAMESIANFAGSYTGAGGYVNQAQIKLNNAVTLFGAITGKVSHLDVVAGNLGTAEAGFVTENAGEIVNCTVGPSTGNMTIGLTYGFAGTNSGTIRGSMANTAASVTAFVGTNNGTIADCYAWYPGTAVNETITDENGTEVVTNTETKIVFAETDEGEIVSSYAAIYGEPAYVLVYDRDGVASFRNTLDGVTLGENWYSYSDKIIEEKGYYPYSTPEGIYHRGGWDKFAEYSAFTGYYYYETNVTGEITGLYIESVGTTGEVVLNTLGENAPAGTAYGIYTVNPIVRESAYEVAEVALTLNSAPIVPSDLENNENESYIREQILKEFGEGYTCDVIKELSSQSVYVLNGTEINTWFAPANADGAYRIRTAEQFAAIEEFSSESYIQETDITIAGPLSYFEGTYDGGENILRYDSEKPLTITLDAANGEEIEIDDGNGGKTTVIRDNVAYGLFANITSENAVIKNCRVVGAIDIKESAEKAKAEHSVEITAAIGGLVGENHGTIKTSSVEGLKVTHTAATVTKGISYTADITLGGLVGLMADGRLDECFVTGDITMTSDAGDSIGGAVGVVDAVEEASVTCMDSYAAVNISASGATVGAFVGKAENGTFYYCHGWNGGAFIGAGSDNARLLKCYYAQEIDGTYKIWTYDGSEVGSLSYESLDQWIKRLNDDRGDIWSTKTTVLDENGKETGEKKDVKYPVLAGRYDANAVGTATLYIEEPAEPVKTPTVTETPAVTAAPEATEQPDVTAEPETTEQPDVTAEPETTEAPAETAAPEVNPEATPKITPEPTAEPTPVPTETPVVEVTPEPTEETEPVSEEA